MKSLLETVTETDYEHKHNHNSSRLDEKDEKMNSCCEFDLLDSQSCWAVEAELEAAILEGAEKKLFCQIICPPGLVSQVSQDILRMSMVEPCGVRGCAIYIMLQEKDKSRCLATIFGDPSAPPTFEIHLTLKEDNRSWKKLQKVYYSIRGCILNSQWTAMPKILCSVYQLEKRRLYRRSDSIDSFNI